MSFSLCFYSLTRTRAKKLQRRHFFSQTLICLTIFGLVLIVEHRQIALIAALGNIVVFKCFQHCTARLMGMGAIAKTTIGRKTEYLAEIARQLFRLHVERAEALDARSVDEVGGWKVEGGGWKVEGGGLKVEGYHLAECGGVHTRVVSIANFCRLEVGIWYEPIDKGALPYPAIATEQRDLAFEQRAQFFYALACSSRYLATFVADVLIECDHHLLVVTLIVTEQVGLVKNKVYGHAISLCRGKEAVDKGC